MSRPDGKAVDFDLKTSYSKSSFHAAHELKNLDLRSK